METRTDLTAFARKTGEIKQRIAEIIVGQTEAVDLLLTCVIADGHVLLEGVPGVAKTLLARLVSRLIDARFSRVQFTPDLMPSDVLGTSVFNMKTSEFDFHPGPAFADIVFPTKSTVLLPRLRLHSSRLWRSAKPLSTARLMSWAMSTPSLPRRIQWNMRARIVCPRHSSTAS